MRSLADKVLSPREKQTVLIYSVLGTQVKTAEAMGVSPTTVKTHITNSLQRKHCTSAVQLLPVCLIEGDITLKMVADARELYQEV